MVSFIDRNKVSSVKVRGVQTWGYSWIKAGWEVIGETKGGLLAMGLRAERMPDLQHARDGSLFDSDAEVSPVSAVATALMPHPVRKELGA